MPGRFKVKVSFSSLSRSRLWRQVDGENYSSEYNSGPAGKLFSWLPGIFQRNPPTHSVLPDELKGLHDCGLRALHIALPEIPLQGMYWSKIQPVSKCHNVKCIATGVWFHPVHDFREIMYLKPAKSMIPGFPFNQSPTGGFHFSLFAGRPGTAHGIKHQIAGVRPGKNMVLRQFFRKYGWMLKGYLV